jgi:hypothetical protein
VRVNPEEHSEEIIYRTATGRPEFGEICTNHRHVTNEISRKCSFEGTHSFKSVTGTNQFAVLGGVGNCSFEFSIPLNRVVFDVFKFFRALHNHAPVTHSDFFLV